MVVRAGIDAADGGRLVARALAGETYACLAGDIPLTLIAIGKASAPMAAAFVQATGLVSRGVVVSTHASANLPAPLEWQPSSHPVPTAASETAGRRALQLAAESRALVVLLSGGASALAAVPRPGLTLDDTRHVIGRLLESGADIGALNTVRRHLSALAGGNLAAAARGPVLALVISDVVGDDLSVVGSGPTVADPTTFADALAVLDRFGGRSAYPDAVVRFLVEGDAGHLPETPKPGDPRLASAVTRLVGSSRDAVLAAAGAAAAAGYRACVLTDPVVGEARMTGPVHAATMLRAAAASGLPAAVVSAGETTVRVRGAGRGGRNQELALASAAVLAGADIQACFASVGTDGIDGPTGAAGAIADTTTWVRLQRHGLSADEVLDNNDSHSAFAALGDLIITGPTETNVGDLQVLLAG